MKVCVLEVHIYILYMLFTYYIICIILYINTQYDIYMLFCTLNKHIKSVLAKWKVLFWKHTSVCKMSGGTVAIMPCLYVSWSVSGWPYWTLALLENLWSDPAGQSLHPLEAKNKVDLRWCPFWPYLLLVHGWLYLSKVEIPLLNSWVTNAPLAFYVFKLSQAVSLASPSTCKSLFPEQSRACALSLTFSPPQLLIWIAKGSKLLVCVAVFIPFKGGRGRKA